MEENKEIKEENNVQPVNSTNEVNNQELMPVKKNNGLVIVLVIIILLLVAGLVYVLFFTNDEEKGNEKDSPTVTSTPEPSKPIDDEVTPTPSPTATDKPTEDNNGDYELKVYRYKDSKYLTDSTKDDEGLEVAFTIKTDTQDAKLLDVDYLNNYIVLYSDNGVYVYNSKTKSKEKMDLESSYEKYSMYFNEKNDKVIGIGYLNKNKEYGYYNISKKTKLYDKKYKLEDSWAAYQINDHYLVLESNGMDYLLSTDSEDVKLSNKDDSEMNNYSSFGTNGNYMYGYGASPDIACYTKFYGKSFNLFYDDDESICEQYVSFVNNQLYLYDGNSVLKYNTNGDASGAYTKYNDVKMLIKNYVIYVKDGNLIIENIENNSESKVLTKWDNNWSIDIWDSADYSRSTLDDMEEEDKKAGIYVVIDYPSKDANGNYGMEYCYTTDKQVVEYPIKQEKGGRAKPVLYLYPEKEIDVTVKFSHPEYLTTTYPKYINSWNVTVKPNGDMKDKDGKYYYALYWDETRYSETNFKEGFYVEGKDAIKFLEEKLSIIGLNAKERNEFIMYWLPIMEKNGKNLVYFELTNEREASNKLIITPKPDSLLRVSIHIKKVNEKVSIKEQKLPTFKRSGFVAIEWGGMTY